MIHDIDLFPKYYDPIYHPCCHPKLFETPMAVKEWIESALNSHDDDCHRCLSKHINSSFRYSVQWRESYFVVCTFLNGKLKQCTVSPKELISHNYTHCWLLSRLHGKTFPLKSDVKIAPLLENEGIFNVVAKEDPSWLYHSDAFYRLLLSQVSVSVLAAAIKSWLRSNFSFLQEAARRQPRPIWVRWCRYRDGWWRGRVSVISPFNFCTISYFTTSSNVF